MNAISKISEAADALVKARSALAQIDWTNAQCGDAEIGRHLTDLEAHLDKALGRVSALRDSVRRHDAAQAGPR